MNSNCRSHLLNLLLNLSLLVGMVVAPWVASSQVPISSADSGLAEDRVTQLEHIYKAHSQLLVKLQQQIQENQIDIDILRGQIQDNQYQLNQVVKSYKQIQSQLNGVSNGNDTAQSILGSQADDANSGIGTTPVHNSNLNTDYNAAIALVQDSSRQDDAIQAFQNFIKQYPDSAYQPNANYWLGQLNYNKGKKDDAAFYFAYVVKNYPISPKAADAMYKVAVIIEDKGDTAKAKAIYQQVVTKYPGTEGAKQARKRLRAL